MRRLLFLSALCLTGCLAQPTRTETATDPLFGGGGPIPTRAVADRREEFPAPRVAPPPPAASVGSSPAALATGAVASAGVTLGSPRPANASAAPLPITSSILPAGGTVPATYEQLQAKLKARGVDWQVLTQRGSASWHFLCAIPDPKHPGMRLNHETARPCPTPLAAMEAVLREIEAAGVPQR